MKNRQIIAMGLGVLMMAVSPATIETWAEQAAEAVTETAPVTEAPVTEAPVTEAPVTEAPVTEAPVTEAPVTEAPVTEAPVTEAPATEPSVEAAETASSSTEPISDTEAVMTEIENAENVPLEPDSETDSEKITEINSLIEDITEKESETEETHITNQELIARQNIVTPPDISLEFRFVQVEKNYGVIRNPEGAFIYEKRSESARAVGQIDYYGLCYILERVGEDWIYVESGNVRGFLPTSDLADGDTAARLVSVKGESNLPAARLTVARSENTAFTYTHTTVQPVLASKVYAVAKKELNIYEARQSSARVTGKLPANGLCYILADENRDWVYVESGNARGFVETSSLELGKSAAAFVEEKGEANMDLAEVQISPEDNDACYYTLTSVKAASQSALLRSSIVNFSFRFLGNPYVWGGTSLTNGCDCSGFTQSIYANFGYSIPRIAEAQAVCGMQIPISSAEPGDLIFYAKDGAIYHVSMYIGNGQVIHAYGTSTGIITSGIGSSAVWAVRIIQD